MGPVLIFIRKIQIYIRYLVAVESHEYRKGNIVTVTRHIRPAVGTGFGWHVKTTGIFTVFEKLCMPAFWAAIMRYQRVHFRNVCHTGNQAGTY